ncbi:4Fe-4S binding protein [Chloroflexota bacterium]
MEHNILETNLLGFMMKSPIMVASSFLTRNAKLMRLAEKNGAGGVSTKAAFMKVPFSFQPSINVLPHGMGIQANGDARIDYKRAKDIIQEIKQDTQMMILGNVMGSGMDLESWQHVAQELEEAGADAMELDLACPNRAMGATLKAPPGTMIAQYAHMSKDVTEAVKAVVHIPITCKLTAVVSSLREVAEACEEAGADAITVTNGLPGVPPIDIWDDGSISFMKLDKSNLGGVVGPPIFYQACNAVAQVSQATKIPVIGCGGITTWQDAVQMIMWGANALQICTGITLYGFKLIDDINRGLEYFMTEKGYSTIDDFRGAALQNILPPEQLEFQDLYLTVRQDLCNLCMRCLSIGPCLAISFRDNAIYLDNDECITCGTCIGVCPQRAIEFHPKVAVA